MPAGVTGLMGEDATPLWVEVDERDLAELRETGTLMFEFDGDIIESNPSLAIDYAGQGAGASDRD